jgi:hypothetical protein
VLLTLPEAPTLVLVHSPLIGPAAWGQAPHLLTEAGYEVVVLDVRPTGPDEPVGAFISNAAVQISAGLTATPDRNVVLVGQHEAGPLLPHLGAAQTASGRRVGRYILVNALLPKPYGARGANSMLDLIESGDSGRADALRGMLLEGVRFPNWQDADLADLITDDAARAEVIAATYPRDLAWFGAPLPVTAEWPNAPVTSIQSAPECDWEARQAALRGWSVVHTAGGTFAGLSAAPELAAAIAAQL